MKVAIEGKIMETRGGRDWTGGTLTIRAGVLYLDLILSSGWGATLKTIFLHPHKTVRATCRITGLRGVWVKENMPDPGFTGNRGLAECSPGCMGGGCGHKG